MKGKWLGYEKNVDENLRPCLQRLLRNSREIFKQTRAGRFMPKMRGTWKSFRLEDPSRPAGSSVRLPTGFIL